MRPKHSNVLSLRDPLYGPGGTGPLTFTAYCEAGVQVNDIVRISDYDDNVYVTCIDNRSDNIAIGLVVARPASDKCEILIYGIHSVSIARNTDFLFVGTDGRLTTEVPGDGYVQYFGLRLSPTSVFIQPSKPIIKRNPF